ncbi:MAG: DUF1697 domain-containing protein [Woeseiaceae bacterium]
MTTWIVLLRGINVGGRNIVPMKTLVGLLQGIGCSQIKTYIQSGNVVLRSPQKSSAILKKEIQDSIESEFSFRPTVMVLSASQLAAATETNPFPEGTVDPATLHFFFLSDIPVGYDESVLQDMSAAKERFQLVESVFYLLAPNGIGRSKLAANVEKKLGVATTARNFRTVDKLVQLAAEVSGT